ncbi:MAG TPA: HPr family phosphocarrier protein [Baekduia sp.]|uniref:HPr family phosphocarrier protein n=1 Tax=Baekduia sp. TaxID=2600305 RepID=UPI002D7730C1|nr:HPr family phosphocarrier protein [Baekduia sp.]HET6506940.1 HPr family phosphocarrier protein [Baekduia sp.]
MPASSEAQTTATLPSDVDLHARPAAAFVRAAMAFEASVTIAADDREADAKSLLSVLALGAKAGTSVTLRADGPDAARAVDTLGELIAGLVETPG